MTSDLNSLTGRIRNLLKYFGFIMVLVYFGVGLALLLVPEEVTVLNRTTKLILGIALVLYGIFRAWRVIKTYNNEKPVI
jgi:hypothetical protein